MTIIVVMKLCKVLFVYMNDENVMLPHGSVKLILNVDSKEKMHARMN